MKRRGTMLTEGLKVIRCGVTFVTGDAVLRVHDVPFFHASVAMRFGEDGGSSDRNAARVAFDERFLFDENIELHGIDEQIIRLDRELLQSGGHGLAAGLIDVPGVDALGIDFGDGPCHRMLANSGGEFHAALGGKFFRIVEADNATLGIENHRGGDDGTEERAAAGFIKTGDAHPAKLSRRSLETGGAETAHCAEILARGRYYLRSLVAQRHDGVDFCGALGRQVRRYGRYRAQKETGSGERQWIRRPDIEQHAAEQTA